MAIPRRHGCEVEQSAHAEASQYQSASESSFGFRLIISATLMLLVCQAGCGGGRTQQPLRNFGGDDDEPAKTPVATMPSQAPAEAAEPDSAAGEGAQQAQSLVGDAKRLTPEATGSRTANVATDKLPQAPVAVRSRNDREQSVSAKSRPRPLDVADWRKADYFSAKAAGDKRLVEALQFFGETFIGNEQAAGMLGSLLAGQETPPQGGVRNRQLELAPKQISRAAVSEIVRALGKNRTPSAVELFRQLLDGKIETPLEHDQCVTESIKAMALNSDYKPYEDLLYKLVTQPETFNLQETTANLRARTKQGAAQVVAKLGTPPLKLRLAGYVNQPGSNPKTVAQLISELQENLPQNWPAQRLMVQGDRLSETDKAKLRSHFVENSALALKTLLGFEGELIEPPAFGEKTESFHAVSSEERQANKVSYDFARQIWTTEFCNSIKPEMAAAKSLDEAAASLSLLSTIPLASARDSMRGYLTKHAMKGPSLLAKSGLESRITDPANIVLIKNIYHEFALRSSGDDERTPLERKEAREKWSDSIRPALESWLAHCYSASRRAEARGDRLRSVEEIGFPLRLPKGVPIVAQYHLIWPEDGKKVLPNIEFDPVEIHYVRIEQEGQAERLFPHYQRQASRSHGAHLSKLPSGVWVDGLVIGSTQEAMRSVDIRFLSKKRAPNELNPLEEPTEDLVIEILTIEYSPSKDSKVKTAQTEIAKGSQK